MKEILAKELKEAGALSAELPPILNMITKAIPDATIPERFKQTIAVSELILYASHLRRNMTHWDGGSIPVNSIAFVIAGSGTGKDSSVNAARKCFKPGYDIIKTERKRIAKQNAIDIAFRKKLDMPSDYDTYKKFYIPPDDLFAAPDSTIKGLHKHFNALEASGIGGGFVYSGEFSTELAAGTVGDLMKYMSEVYDMGAKEIKLIGDKSEQLVALESLPVSALFVGSQDPILFDEKVKKIFKTEFSSKLARRAYFCFAPETIPDIDYSKYPNPSKAMLEAEMKEEDDAMAARAKIMSGVKQLTKTAITIANTPLPIGEGVRKLFLIYRRYNKEVAKDLSETYPISALVRTHLQWKALKLAGALALFAQHKKVEVSDYIQAINFCESLDKDMCLFEQELAKEPYEQFVSYVKSRTKNNKFEVTLHKLRKLGYIAPTGASKGKLIELAKLASSYDEYGVYMASDKGIQYEEVVPTPMSGLSFVKVTGSKQSRAKQCTAGFKFAETTFASLAEMLTKDFAYTPFQFKGGIRGKDNLIGGVKWIVLDIDESAITAGEAHQILQDINHHIALTSDPNNDFKFRVLLELDSFVEIQPLAWKYFIGSIASSLALTPDLLPQSQIYFSYAGREVLSVIDKEAIEVKDHLLVANDKLNSKPVAIKPVTKAEALAKISDPLNTFNQAFEAGPGEGTRKLVWAAYEAHSLGMSQEEIVNLLYKINDYWDYPMPEDRLQLTVLPVVRRLNQ